MKLFTPERLYIEEKALEYPLGKHIYDMFSSRIPTKIMKTTRVTGIPGETERHKFLHSKKTLVVTTKKSLSFDICRPSADYQFPLATSCPANCEYCYLQTTQGTRPYIRVYANINEIFDSIKKHIAKKPDEITTFEASSTSDPVALEHITGSLSKTIKFFGTLDKGRLRVVTKFSNVEPFININHKKHTRFRFSINSDYVINTFEHTTAPLNERITASAKVNNAGYPIGFIIAPLMIYENWKDEYKRLFENLANEVKIQDTSTLTFELIQHRYTNSARKLIHERFPNTKLDMNDDNRSLKWGKYGKYKYIYPKEQAEELQSYISGLIQDYFPGGVISYFT